MSDPQFDGTLIFFRQEQARQFSDTATVLRSVGEPTFNTATEAHDQETIEVYSGECKIRPVAIRGEDETDAGETLVATPDSESKFPVNTDLQRGDIVICTASTYDAGMVGRTYTIARAPADGWQIARVVVIEETLPPLLNEDA